MLVHLAISFLRILAYVRTLGREIREPGLSLIGGNGSGFIRVETRQTVGGDQFLLLARSSSELVVEDDI